MLRYHIAAVLFLVATAASAQQPFGVVISGSSEATCELAAGAPHAVQWINPDRTVDFSDILVVASAPGQPVFALLAGSAGGFSGGEIVRIEPDGSRTPFVPASTGFAADNLAVAHTGRVFTTIGAGLAVFSPAGIHEGTYPMPDRIGKIAVAPDDGCTVYYEKTGSVIGRMNGCTGAILPDFTQVLPFGFADFHPLPNGEMIVAKSFALSATIVLYNASGAEVREITTVSSTGGSDTHTRLRMATTPDRTTLWIAGGYCNGMLLQFQISDGRELSRREIDIVVPTGLVLGSAGLGDIPTASETALLLIAIALAAAGVFVLRR